MSESAKLVFTVHPGRGPFHALVHGFLSSSAQWLHNLDALSAICTPVTFELWGHGNSPTPDSMDAYDPDGYTSQLERIRIDLIERYQK